MLDINRLRGVVYAKHRSIAEFAVKAGYSRQKMTRVINGQQTLDINEAKHLADVLNLTPEEAHSIFLL